MTDLYEGIRRVVQGDPRYDRGAYVFVFQALEFTLTKKGERGHVTGQDLLEGIRQLAADKFGFLARTVFNDWGLVRTNDFGEIVFNLVEHDLMKKTETDTRDDFAGGFDFEQAFEKSFQLSPKELELK